MRLAIRTYLFLFGLGLFMAYLATGRLRPEHYETSAILAAILTPIAYLPRAFRRILSSRSGRDPLDHCLFPWPDGTEFTRRDMARSVSGKGITGTGKSSSTYQHFLECLVNDPLATLSIYPQKEEERQQIIDAYARAGRSDKLIIVEPGGKYRCNYYTSMQNFGFDPLAMVEFNSVIAEGLESQGGGDRDPFFRLSAKRFDYNAIAMVGLGDKVTAPNLLKFYSTALRDKARLHSDEKFAEEWRRQYHNRTIEKAKSGAITPAQIYDYNTGIQFWSDEYPGMSDRTRSSIEATCMNPLSIATTGVAAVMASTFNNVTPALHAQGYSIVWNTPVSSYGPSGLYLGLGAKNLTQRYILKRKWKPGDFYTVLLCDEYQMLMSPEYDPTFLSMCRSHGGALLTLTQTVNSEYSRMPEHKANMLLSNFGTHIFNMGDQKTETFAAGLLGQRKEAFPTIPGDGNLYEAFNGQQNLSVNFQYQPVLQPGFLQGPWMKTGGPGNDFQVTALVVTPGRAFKSGEVFDYVTFHQRRS